jgi:hypothetical protein
VTADQERAARRRALLHELEELRLLRERMMPRRVRRERLERLHMTTRRST